MRISNRSAHRYRAGIARAIVTAGVGVALALGAPGVAAAEAAWDIGLYDDCMKVAKTKEERERCCIGSGGYPGPLTDNELTCVAPPADQGKPVPPSDPVIAETAGVSDDPVSAPVKPRPSMPRTGGIA